MRIIKGIICLVVLFSAVVLAETKDPNNKQALNSALEKKQIAKDSQRQRIQVTPQEEKEYLDWLGKNMPQADMRLKRLKDNQPKMYQREMRRGVRRLARLKEAGMDNAGVIQIFKEEYRLDEQKDVLVKKINDAKNSDEKQKLISELEKVINGKYDLMIKQKELISEQFQKRVENLQKSLDENKADIEKLKDPSVRDERTKRIIQRLLDPNTPD
jgi:hypothetical protein